MSCSIKISSSSTFSSTILSIAVSLTLLSSTPFSCGFRNLFLIAVLLRIVCFLWMPMLSFFSVLSLALVAVWGRGFLSSSEVRSPLLVFTPSLSGAFYSWLWWWWWFLGLLECSLWSESLHASLAFVSRSLTVRASIRTRWSCLSLSIFVMAVMWVWLCLVGEQERDRLGKWLQDREDE